MNQSNTFRLYQLKKRVQQRAKQTVHVIPPYTIFFFNLFLLNTIIPLLDLPLIGLSITAPLMLFVGFQVILKPSAPWIKHYQMWWLLAAFIWLMWFLSAVLNSIAGNLEPASTSQLIYFIRMFYWLFVFVITTYIVSERAHGLSLIKVLNLGVFILGLMRLYEALFLGRIGPGTSRLLSQNNYGILFSSFALYPIILLVEEKSPKKFPQFIIVGVVYASIIINSSRSSWVALLLGIGVLLFFLWGFKKIRLTAIFGVSAFILFVVLVGLLITPNLLSVINPNSPIVQRFESFSSIEEDLSYATRQFLVRKAVAQFKSSPIFGIGVERGRFVFMDVELPESIKNEKSLLANPLNEHNSYIQVLAETGLVGVIPYSIFLLILFFRGFKAAILLSKQQQFWAVGIFASFISMSIHLWTITALRTTSTWVVYGLLGGMIMYAQRINDKQVAEVIECQ